jgi:hypothetical protein
MTKKEAAFQLLFVADGIDRQMRGNEEADFWVSQLCSLASGLYPPIIEHGKYAKLTHWDKQPSRMTKLRNLIEHEGTSEHERTAAIAALNRLKTNEEG